MHNDKYKEADQENVQRLEAHYKKTMSMRLKDSSRHGGNKRSNTSRTVSAAMLRWSLARSIRMGIFSRRVFKNEIMKTSSRKSTIDIKQRLLINPDSEEGKKLSLAHSRRSRSYANINESLNESVDSITEWSKNKDRDIGWQFHGALFLDSKKARILK